MWIQQVRNIKLLSTDVWLDQWRISSSFLECPIFQLLSPGQNFYNILQIELDIIELFLLLQRGTSFRTLLMIFSTSSSGNRSVISPEDNISLMRTRKLSSGTWASVSRNTIPTFLRPAFRYKLDSSIYQLRIYWGFLILIFKVYEILSYFQIHNSISLSQLNLCNFQIRYESC